MNIFDPQISVSDFGYVFKGTFASNKLVGNYVKYGDDDLIIEDYKVIGRTKVTDKLIDSTKKELEKYISGIKLDKKVIIKSFQKPFEYVLRVTGVSKIENDCVVFKPSLIIENSDYIILWSFKVLSTGDSIDKSKIESVRLFIKEQNYPDFKNKTYNAKLADVGIENFNREAYNEERSLIGDRETINAIQQQIQEEEQYHHFLQQKENENKDNEEELDEDTNLDNENFNYNDLGMETNILYQFDENDGNFNLSQENSNDVDIDGNANLGEDNAKGVDFNKTEDYEKPEVDGNAESLEDDKSDLNISSMANLVVEDNVSVAQENLNRTFESSEITPESIEWEHTYKKLSEIFDTKVEDMVIHLLLMKVSLYYRILNSETVI